MTFQDTSLTKAAFKKLNFKSHTSNTKDLANEAAASGINLSAASVLAEEISSSAAVAVANGVAAFVSVDLTLDPSSGGKAYRTQISGSVPASLVGKTNPLTNIPYVIGDNVGYFISQNYGNDYRAVLKNNGTEVAPLDSADWFFDYYSGVVFSEDNLSLTSGTIDGYVYTGDILQTVLNSLDTSIWQRINSVDGYFLPTGNVGIGTATPVDKLTISDNINDGYIASIINPNAGTLASSRLSFYNNAGQFASFGLNSTAFTATLLGAESLDSGTVLDAPDILVLRSGSTTPIIMGSGTTEHMRVASTGIGIGTTIPSAPLHIYSSASAGASIKLDYNDTIVSIGDILGQIDWSSNDARVGASGIRTSLRGVTSSATGRTDVVIYGTGSGSTTLNEIVRHTYNTFPRVGIGTTQPASYLQVYGIDADDPDISLSYRSAGAISNNDLAASLLFDADASNTDLSEVRVGAKYSSTNDRTELTFATTIAGGSTLTDHMRVASTGFIGIGNSAPRHLLHIGAATQTATNTATNKVAIQNDTASGRAAVLAIGTTSGAVKVEGQFEADGNGSRVLMGSVSSHRLAITAANTESMTMLTTGRVGIGTTNPGSSLVIGSGGQTPANGASTRVAIDNGTNGQLAALVTMAKTGGASKVEGQIESSGSDSSVRIGSNTSHRVELIANADPVITMSAAGLVGIGTTNPISQLHIANVASGGGGSNGIFRLTSTSTSSSNNLMVLDFSSDSTISAGQYFIRFDDAGGTVGGIDQEVVYNTFTGGHEGQADGSINTSLDFEDTDGNVWKQGMIVISTGEPINPSFSRGLVKVKLAASNMSKAAMGVYSGYIKDHNSSGMDKSKPVIKYNALGEGMMLVCNYNGIIELGDYITSCDIPGYGVKQNSDILRNYTVAKNTQHIDWDNISDMIEYNGAQYKVAMITVTYHAG